jgi:hypothetical protein
MRISSLLAGSIDPGQEQLPAHLISAGGPAESPHLAAAGPPVPPGGGPSPRTSSATGHPTAAGACPRPSHPEAGLLLPGRDPLLPNSLQQLRPDAARNADYLQFSRMRTSQPGWVQIILFCRIPVPHAAGSSDRRAGRSAAGWHRRRPVRWLMRVRGCELFPGSPWSVGITGLGTGAAGVATLRWRGWRRLLLAACARPMPRFAPRRAVACGAGRQDMRRAGCPAPPIRCPWAGHCCWCRSTARSGSPSGRRWCSHRRPCMWRRWGMPQREDRCPARLGGWALAESASSCRSIAPRACGGPNWAG